jgi:hypothetical protein
MVIYVSCLYVTVAKLDALYIVGWNRVATSEDDI